MNMITIQWEIPEEMKPYIDKTISHGRAAEILGMSKLDLFDLYANIGFPYFDLL